MNQRTVIIKNDELGLVQFMSISDAIKRRSPNKNYLSRLAKIAAVFDHRTSIAVHAADSPTRWEANAFLERLNTFKKPEFFIGAATALLEEIVQDDTLKAAELEKKRQQRSARYWG